MKTANVKAELYREIEGLTNSQLTEIFGIFRNYLNGKDDTEDWSALSVRQQEKIKESIGQANAGRSRPAAEVTKQIRSKYKLNG